MELGRWTAISYGVIDNRSENLQHCQWALAQWAALKDQQKRGGVELNGAYFPRVRARAEPSDALRRQTDPLEPAGRRFANFFFESSFSTVLQRNGYRNRSEFSGKAKIGQALEQTICLLLL
jgi:hypothetical protein